MTSSTSYQPLSSHGSGPPLQQRKAFTFTLMIMMVAFATLLTIIRLTISPDLSGQTPSFLMPLPATSPDGGQSRKHLSKLKTLNSIEKTERKLLLAGLQPLPSSAIRLLAKTAEIQQTSGSSQAKGNLPLPTVSKAVVQQQQQPSQAAVSTSGVTSILTADQRFEKEYRDDPVTDAVPGTDSQLQAVGSKIQEQESLLRIRARANVLPKSATPRRPKLVFTPADLEETKRLRIDKTEGCGEASGAYADLLVIVNSAVGNFAARSAIRDTWGRFAVERGAYFYLLVGSTDNPTIQEQIEAEDLAYGDLLQGRFYDSYHNLTLKTLSMMRWVAERCSAIRYVLKVDDDMMLNMQHITDFAEINPNLHRAIIGKLAKRWRPHRETTNKWYVPVAAYNGTVFPPFVTGPAYFFTGDAAKPLLEAATNDRTGPLYLEDVYVTGIAAEKAGIKRFNHGLIRNVHLKVDECSYPKIMTSHKHRPADIRALWKLVYSKKCIPPPPVKVVPTNTTTSKTGKVAPLLATALKPAAAIVPKKA